MYKTQFTRWGFEKNITRSRVQNFLYSNTTTKSSVRKALSVTRLERYFKRRKVSDSPPADISKPVRPESSLKSLHETPFMSLSELPDTCALELPGTRVFPELPDTSPLYPPCQFHKKGYRRFRISIEDRYGLILDYT